MATERFNRQFILVDFEDLDNPEFMEFVRSPEFSTYLVMRRHIWRSNQPHSLGLHEYYAQGFLACALSREKIAEALGGVTPRTVTKDINALIRRGVIRSVTTGRGNIFILGKWAIDEEEGVYYEYFFLDKLHTRLEENFQADWNPNPGGKNLPGSLEETFQADRNASNPGGRKLPGRVEKKVQAEEKNASTNNREENRERIENKRETHDNNNTESNSSDVVVALTELGISQKVARRLVSRYGRERILEKIDFLAFLQETDPARVKHPRGWLRRAIEEDYGPPDGYKPKEEREAEAAEREKRQREAEEAFMEREPWLTRLGNWQRWVVQTLGVPKRLQELTCQLLENLKLQMPVATFQAWVANTMITELREGRACIAVPSERAYEWLHHRLKPKFEQALATIIEEQVDVTFQVIEQPPRADPMADDARTLLDA